MNKPAAPATGATSQQKKAHPKFILPLPAMLNGKSFNQLEALREFNDTCFNSTISVLANKFGLKFIRTRERHHHRGGGISHFVRYRLSPESQEAAAALLKHYEAASERGAHGAAAKSH